MKFHLVILFCFVFRDAGLIQWSKSVEAFGTRYSCQTPTRSGPFRSTQKRNSETQKQVNDETQFRCASLCLNVETSYADRSPQRGHAISKLRTLHAAMLGAETRVLWLLHNHKQKLISSSKSGTSDADTRFRWQILFPTQRTEHHPSFVHFVRLPSEINWTNISVSRAAALGKIGIGEVRYLRANCSCDQFSL